MNQGKEKQEAMNKEKKNQEEKHVDENLNIENLKTTPRPGNYITTILICLALVGAGVFFILKIADPVEKWVIGIGLCFVAVYIYLISMISQKPADYRFEFVPGEGLRDFKLFYRDREIELAYKLDRFGKFMWADYKHKAVCISRKDKKMDGPVFNNFTKYRIMNYVNGFLTQNDLMSKNAY